MKTVVFGKSGQLAQSLHKVFPEAIFLGRDSANFEHPLAVVRTLNELKPKLIINAAAYTAVDKAEIEPGRAQLINAETPGDIAFWCKDNGASLIHYSTDYVYSGEGSEPWKETDAPEPVNRYGITKFNGELAIAESECHAIVIRTSWLFSAYGSNFVKTMRSLGATKDSISVVGDQMGSPTYAMDLAAATLQIVNHETFTDTSGVFNLANSGFASWYDFAAQIFSDLRRHGVKLQVEDVRKISTMEYPRPAPRPKNSCLNLDKSSEVFGLKLRPWQVALNDCVSALTSGNAQ